MGLFAAGGILRLSQKATEILYIICQAEIVEMPMCRSRLLGRNLVARSEQYGRGCQGRV